MPSVMNGNGMPHEMGVAGFKPALNIGGKVVHMSGEMTGGEKHAHFHNSPEKHAHFDDINMPVQKSTAPVAPTTTGQHGKHEPLSPAMSSISTHCGGSPKPVPSGSFSAMTTRSLSNMSALELCNMSSVSGTAADPNFIGGLGRKSQIEMLAEEEEEEVHAVFKTPRNKLANNKPVSPSPKEQCNREDAPIRRPKAKGEAQPCLEKQHSVPTHQKSNPKIFDEAHHFGLCEHYAKLLDQAKEVGFKNVKWPTNFTLFHLAAKKNNKEFIEWLVQNDVDDVHTIDDFGKKPIDYSCPRKRDSVHDTLHAMMLAVPVPDTPAQIKYQQIKNGTYVDPEKLAAQERKKKLAGQNCMAAILKSADIAQGDVPEAKPGNMMTAYEAETMVPVEYKKCFKKMSSGGWNAMEGNWPHQGQTVLHWAARNGKEELCHFLVLEYGADPHQEDGSGHDAMYHAKLKRHRKLAKRLLLKFKEPKSVKGKKK